MQLVILAAGKSSRFYPYTTYSHKTLVTLMGKSILEHTLESVKKTGIKDVVIIVGPESTIPDHLGDGKKLGLNISYAVQEEPLGMGNALLSAKPNISGDFFLLNAYHVDFHEFYESMIAKKESGARAVLLARHEKNLSKYGFLKIDGDTVLDLVEKPTDEAHTPSNYRLIGIYLLGKEFMEELGKTLLHHDQLEEALASFAKKENVRVVITEKAVTTLKYPWDILQLKNYLMSELKGYVSPSSTVSASATLIGEVHISDGATVLEGACVKGPAYIGEDVMIGNNTLIRNGASIEKGAKIGAYTEVKNSLFMKHATIHSGFVGDSLVGEGTKIGAGFSSGNVRLKRDNVTVTVKGEKIDTGMRSFGVILGKHVKTGVKVATMPGIVVGNNVIIGPSTTVMKNIDDNTTYYTKFKEIVEKKNEKN